MVDKKKQMMNVLYFFKAGITYTLIVVSFFYLNSLFAYANKNETSNLDIYKVEPDLLDTYDVIERGTTFDLVLPNDVYSHSNDTNKEIVFEAPGQADANLKIVGSISMISESGRMSKSASLGFSTNKLYLDDGREAYFSANSPLFKSIYPPHANSNSIGLARKITSLSLAGGPLTFGVSLGIGFLASGLLSAYQNGLRDFFWGGLDGTGFSFVERIFRKQPELNLGAGSVIPFTLNDDLKISKGIHGEKLEKINLSNSEALEKIQQLLKWGDLTGALELSIKTGQKEKYDEIMRKISL